MTTNDMLMQCVERYGVMRAYETVCETCLAPEVHKLMQNRRAEFADALDRYAKHKYKTLYRNNKKQARFVAMDDVLYRRNQLSIFWGE